MDFLSQVGLAVLQFAYRFRNRPKPLRPLPQQKMVEVPRLFTEMTNKHLPTLSYIGQKPFQLLRQRTLAFPAITTRKSISTIAMLNKATSRSISIDIMMRLVFKRKPKVIIP
ncbi:hypothetical protein [Neolewinella agarilytica]|uniref:Uncharacterized protein n=1 Tax=Neolewinella agarilytica TaxID=478744 RepID=A0A1H9HD70_9BACT|nr:hypothetical protein [Neolewinella agarilytica]SEQ60237.1 hypothetical protein SAMN05444359_112111 [Neolewinella agarilytica]